SPHTSLFYPYTTLFRSTNSLEEMVSAAQRLGFEYIGISDHSATAVYANGLKKERVLDQFKKIEALRKKYKIQIFCGIESDILTRSEEHTSELQSLRHLV